MSSYPKIVFQGPINLTGYDRSLPPSSQPSHIPAIFLSAMTVREEVFVKEQGVPLNIEADSDDTRSCHWIAFDKATPESEPEPVGTLRLVPFPHSAHPEPDSDWDVPDGEEGSNLAATPLPWIVDRQTSLHDGLEPYVKLGRWAVRKEFRGRGIADLLATTALLWVKENATFFNVEVVKNEEGLVLDSHRTVWNGLVCVHAQAYLEKAWSKYGFVTDESMGKWTEAQIPHVGMFQRIELPETA